MAGSMGKDIQSKISRCFPYEANKGTFAVKSSGRLNNKCGKNKCFFRNVKLPYLDTSNSSIREQLLAFFSYIANSQLKRYSEAIKSGQKRALAQGKRIGSLRFQPS